MNKNIPLSVLAVASVIGLMAVTGIQIPQTAYSGEAWCFIKDKPLNEGGTWDCAMRNQDQCNSVRDAYIKQGKIAASECFKD
jgi:hypothetical protein